MLQSVKKLFSVIDNKCKKKFYLVVTLAILNSIFEVVGISAVLPFLLLLLSPEKLIHSSIYQNYFSYYLPSTNYLRLVYVSSALLTFGLILKAIFYVASQYINAYFVTVTSADIRQRIYEKYMFKDYLFHIERSSSKLTAIISNEVNNFENFFVYPLILCLSNSIILVAILSFLLCFSPIATLLILGCFGFSTLIMYMLVIKNIKQQGMDRLKATKNIHELALHGLGGIKETKILLREHFYTELFKTNSTTLIKANLARTLSGLLPRPILETTSMLSIIGAMLIMLGIGIPSKNIVITISLFAIASIRLLPSLNQILINGAALRYSSSSIDTLKEELDLKTNNHLKTKTNSPTIDFRTLSLEKISFWYPNTKKPALRDINLRLRKGESIGIVGSSGAGKSSLIDVILGLLKPQSGNFKLNSIDFDASSDSWKKNIGYIPQNIFVANATIRENIALGLPNNQIDDNKIWNALKLSQLSDFVEKLPNGIEEHIGENGLKISGGQRQRIAIARALYNQPKILVMDEATSALDNQTEEAFINALNSLHGKITMIIIAHRFNTIKACDRIYVLEDGEITNEGKYDELLNESSIFAKLSGN